MVRVMVFGTFDLLHDGHKNFFKQAKELGDDLIVVVGLDSNVAKIKGKKPVQNVRKRVQAIERLGIATEVIKGHRANFFEIIEEAAPDVIALGYDQKSLGLEEYLEENEKKMDFMVVRLKPYKENLFKSTLLRETLF